MIPWVPLVASVAAALTGSAPPDTAAAVRRAKMGDVGLTLTVLADDASITLGEPLLARVELTNKTNQQIELWTGDGSAHSTYLEVHDTDGKRVSSTPRPRPRGGIQRARVLPPGARHSQIWVITGFHDFREPGAYMVRTQLLEASQGTLRPIAEAQTQVSVLPFNVARLEARCEELFQRVRRRSRGDAIPLGAAARALETVRHDIALPYLDWMAREWGNTSTCLAIRRVGTTRAQSLIQALAARQDRVGKAARQALEMPLGKPTGLDLQPIEVSDAPAS